ncbi:MAG: hypothetical protein ACFFD2_00190 [Promethearchaeota archaeon]
MIGHGIICGASILSIAGSIPTLVNSFSYFLKSMQEIDLDEILKALKELDTTILENQDALEILTKHFKKIQVLKTKRDILLGELSSHMNLLEIQDLQDIFKKNRDVSYKYTESRFGLYVHKPKYCNNPEYNRTR